MLMSIDLSACVVIMHYTQPLVHNYITVLGPEQGMGRTLTVPDRGHHDCGSHKWRLCACVKARACFAPHILLLCCSCVQGFPSGAADVPAAVL